MTCLLRFDSLKSFHLNLCLTRVRTAASVNLLAPGFSPLPRTCSAVATRPPRAAAGYRHQGVCRSRTTARG